MFSKFPSKIAALALAIPLVAAPVSPKIEADTHAISLSLQAALSAEPQKPKPEYIINGTQRITRVRGENLNLLHTLAYKTFISEVEKEIKDPKKAYVIGYFETDIRWEDGEYIFEYRIRLTPTTNPRQIHRMVDMQGTVKVGPTAEQKVKAENAKKVPPWQRSLPPPDSVQTFWFESAEVTTTGPDGLVYHEAVLAKGAVAAFAP